ncbi:MAG: hypothetical protein ACLFM0_00725 [Spirochaetales bacterium]
MRRFVRGLAIAVVVCLLPTPAVGENTRVVDTSSNTRVLDTSSSIRLFDTSSNTRVVDTGSRADTLHLTAGFSAAMFSGGISSLLLSRRGGQVRPGAVAATAFGSALAAGLAKEAADMMGFGEASGRDLLITAAGGVIGTFLVTTSAASTTEEKSGRAMAGASTGAGLVFSIPVQIDLYNRIFRD